MEHTAHSDEAKAVQAAWPSGAGRAGDGASLSGEKVHVAQRSQESFLKEVVPQLDCEGQVGFEQGLVEVTLLPRMWYHRPCHRPCARPPSTWCDGQCYVSFAGPGLPGCTLFLGTSVRVSLDKINL